MPYIPQDMRLRVEGPEGPQTAGQLNYAITRIIDKYLGPDPIYQDINDALGALEGAKLELYRRVAVPLEERKRAENGDVYRERDQ